MREWSTAAAVIAVAVAIAYYPILLGFESFYHLDKQGLHVPFWEFTRNALAQGVSPAWTPDIRGGFPLLAYGPANQLYPLSYLFLPFFPAYRALDLFALLHVALGGLFCWRYLRDIANDHFLALAGGLAFCLSGRMTGLTIWADAVAAFAYLPLLLWAIDQRRVVIIAIALGLSALTGRSQVHVFTLLLGAVYSAYRIGACWRDERKFPAPLVRGHAAGFFAGALLGAVQALPTLLLLSDSDLGDGVSRALWLQHTLQSVHTAQVFLPGIFPGAWPEAAGYPTGFVYVGLLLFAWRAIRLPRETLRGPALFWLPLAVLAAYMATGGPGTYAVTQALPILRSIRVPARFAMITQVAILSVAVMSWAAVLRNGSRARWVLLAFTIVDGVAAAHFSRLSVDTVAFTTKPAAVDLLRNEAKDETGSPRRYYAEETWIWPDRLRGRERDFIAGAFARQPPAQNLSMTHGLRHIMGHGEPRLRWESPPLTEGTLRQMGVSLMFLSRASAAPRLTRVPFAGTDAFVYRLAQPSPRAYVVSRLRIVRDLRAALLYANRRDFDFRHEAVVEAESSAGQVLTAPGGGSTDGVGVRLAMDRPTRVVFEVERNPGPGWLFVSDTWAPGWRAEVNGVPQDIMRANSRARLVPIPAGTSTVSFEYTTPGLYEGAALSLIGLLGLFLWKVRRGRAR